MYKKPIALILYKNNIQHKKVYLRYDPNDLSALILYKNNIRRFNKCKSIDEIFGR